MRKLMYVLALIVFFLAAVPLVSAQETAEPSPVVFQTNTLEAQATEVPAVTEVVIIPTVEVTPVPTLEPTPGPVDPTDTQTEVINETSRLIVVGMLALGFVALIVLSSVLTFAVIALGKSVPAPFAQPYYGAVYSGEKILESGLAKLEQRAAATPEDWDDKIAAIARQVYNEQYAKVQQDAASRNVTLPDITTTGG